MQFNQDGEGVPLGVWSPQCSPLWQKISCSDNLTFGPGPPFVRLQADRQGADMGQKPFGRRMRCRFKTDRAGEWGPATPGRLFPDNLAILAPRMNPPGGR